VEYKYIHSYLIHLDVGSVFIPVYLMYESIFLPNFDFVKHLLVELDFSSSNDWLIELTYILNMNDKILEMLETNENKNAMEEILIYSIQKSVLWIFYWL
jgi:hypothetical protein